MHAFEQYDPENYSVIFNGIPIEGFAEDDLEANLQRDKHARLCNMVSQLIDELTPSAPDFQLRDACDQLVSSDLLAITHVHTLS